MHTLGQSSGGFGNSREESDRLYWESTNGYKSSVSPAQKAFAFEKGGHSHRALPFATTLNNNVMTDRLDRKDFNVVHTWNVYKRTGQLLAHDYAEAGTGLADQVSTVNPNGLGGDNSMVDAAPQSLTYWGDDTARGHDTNEVLTLNKFFAYKFPTHTYKYDFKPTPSTVRGGQFERLPLQEERQFTGVIDGNKTKWHEPNFFENAHGHKHNYQLYMCAYDNIKQQPTRQLCHMRVEMKYTYRTGADPVNS
jgi:hypothetical protein